MKILILSAPIQSGKTTKLMSWFEKRDKVDGILAPVKNNRRHIFCIGNNQLIDLEDVTKIEDQLKIGRFTFSLNAFNQTRKYLQQIDPGETDWIIIDEIGPLELNGKGLEPALSECLNKWQRYPVNIILVVRDYLLDGVIKKYNVEHFQKFDFSFI